MTLLKRTVNESSAAVDTDDMPMNKRLKPNPDIKTTPTPLTPLLTLVANALAEISDDDETAAPTEVDVPKVVKINVPSKVPASLPSAVQALRARESKFASTIATSSNYCHTGKPLACPPMLLQKNLETKFALKEIDCTLQ